MQVSIRTYGCTLNQSDSELMSGMLGRAGISVSDGGEPDVLVVNTCTVKKVTEQKILYLLSGLERQGKRVVVTGCLASANKDKIEKAAPHASIVSTSNIDRIAEAVTSAARGNKVVLDGYRKIDKLSFFNRPESVIAKVPVSEGCLSNCSFCETRFARGPLNSFSEQLILKAVEYSVRRGAREIQLTSQDMGAYGLERGTNIVELMHKIALIEGDFRVRIGMLNPEHLHRYISDLIDALKDEKFYRFLHLPVQSGSDRVLDSMGRHYSSDEFNGYVSTIRKAVPDITFATDVIVGYPGETEEDFRQTKELIDGIKPGITNISKFAARPHAKASKFRQLPQSVLNRRSTDMYRFTRSIQHTGNSALIGNKVRVLLTERGNASINGRSDTYKEVMIRDGISDLQIGSSVMACVYGASISGVYARAE